MLYREIIAVCSQIHTKHVNTVCGQNVELLNVKRGGRHSWHGLPSTRHLMVIVVVGQILEPQPSRCGYKCSRTTHRLVLWHPQLASSHTMTRSGTHGWKNASTWQQTYLSSAKKTRSFLLHVTNSALKCTGTVPVGKLAQAGVARCCKTSSTVELLCNWAEIWR